MSHMLNLEILTCCKAQLTTFIIISKVTGSVHWFQISVIQRILNKDLRSLFSVFVISQCKCTSGYAEFTIFIFLCDQLVFFIQKEYFFIWKCLAHRKYISRPELPVYNIIRTVTCDLSWSINIYIHNIRQIFSPDIQMFHRHSLS